MVLEVNYDPAGERPVGIPGQIAENEQQSEVGTYTNGTGHQTRKVDLNTGSVSDNTDYDVTINDLDTLTYTSGSGATNESILKGIRDKIRGDALYSAVITATYNSGTLVLESVHDGIGFTLSVSSNLTFTETQAAGEPSAIGFGLGVIDAGAGQFRTKLGKLPETSDFTARDLQWTLDSSPDGEYTITLEVNGDTVVAGFTASADSVDDILNGLQTDLDAENLLSASVDTGATPSELHVTPETDGFADFELLSMSTPGSATFTFTTVAEGDDINDEFAGFTAEERTHEKPGDDTAHQYPAGEDMSVLEAGSIYVPTENTVSADAQVYVRVADQGTHTSNGKVRDGWESGAVPLKREIAKFERSLSKGDIGAEVKVHDPLR